MQQQFATYKDWMWSGRERGAVKTSVHPESNQGHSDLCGLYSQMLCQLSYDRLDALVHSTIEEHFKRQVEFVLGAALANG